MTWARVSVVVLVWVVVVILAKLRFVFSPAPVPHDVTALEPQAPRQERSAAAEQAEMTVSLLQLPPPAAEKPPATPVQRIPKNEERGKTTPRSTLFLFFPERTEHRLIRILSEHLSAKRVAVADVTHLRGLYRLQNGHLTLVITEAIEKGGRSIPLTLSVDLSSDDHAG